MEQEDLVFDEITVLQQPLGDKLNAVVQSVVLNNETNSDESLVLGSIQRSDVITPDKILEGALDTSSPIIVDSINILHNNNEIDYVIEYGDEYLDNSYTNKDLLGDIVVLPNDDTSYSLTENSINIGDSLKIDSNDQLELSLVLTTDVESTSEPTVEPTSEPTVEPTIEPTSEPTVEPTSEPAVESTIEPTSEPTVEPTIEPTSEPTVEPTIEPTSEPTVEPTKIPSPTKNPSNGHGSNGHGSNGHGSNGHGSNGHGSNGHGSNKGNEGFGNGEDGPPPGHYNTGNMHDETADLFIWGKELGTHIDGGSGSDTLIMQNDDWTIALDSGNMSEHKDYIKLFNDASGTITLDNGDQISFEGIEKIEW